MLKPNFEKITLDDISLLISILKSQKHNIDKNSLVCEMNDNYLYKTEDKNKIEKISSFIDKLNKLVEEVHGIAISAFNPKLIQEQIFNIEGLLISIDYFDLLDFEAWERFIRKKGGDDIVEIRLASEKFCKIENKIKKLKENFDRITIDAIKLPIVRRTNKIEVCRIANVSATYDKIFKDPYAQYIDLKFDNHYNACIIYSTIEFMA